jgi:hypothetical protein
MIDAISAATAGIIASVASTAISTGVTVAGAVQQASAARETRATQQKITERNLQVAQQASQIEQAQAQDRARRLLAAQRTAAGAQGTGMAGSPLDVMLASTEQSQYDAALLAYTRALEAQGIQVSGALAGRQAQAQERAAMIEAGGALLSGAAKGYTAYRRETAGKSLLTPKGSEYDWATTYG